MENLIKPAFALSMSGISTLEGLKEGCIFRIGLLRISAPFTCVLSQAKPRETVAGL